MCPARLRLLFVTLLLPVLVWLPALNSPAHADDPLYVEWAALLPGLSDAYDPNSSNDCVAGRLSCITVAVTEMEQRFRPLAQDCSHNAPFALTYLRVTQTYKWSAEQPDYYVDPGWMTHAVAVFAKYYLRAWDTWSANNSSTAVPEAWRIANGRSWPRWTRQPGHPGWRASQIPDSGPNRVRPGMEDEKCRNGGGNSRLSSRTRP